MQVVFIQRKDGSEGGSHKSLMETIKAIHSLKPDWSITLITENKGPICQLAEALGYSCITTALPRYRKLFLRPFFFFKLHKLQQQLRPLQPDAIISNEWVSAPHAYYLSRNTPSRSVCIVRDFAALDRGRKYLLHKCDQLWCVSRRLEEKLASIYLTESKIETVYDIITTDNISSVRKHVNKKKWLLCLGTINSRKQQIEALKVLQALRSSGKDEWGLLIVGNQDDDYRQQVDAYIKNKHLEPHVEIHPFTPDPDKFFNMASALVLTSKREGLARVLIEPFLKGTPAFAYKLDGLDEIYGKHLDAFTAEQGDAQGLAEKIRIALGNTEELKQSAREIQLSLTYRHSPETHIATITRLFNLPNP